MSHDNDARSCNIDAETNVGRCFARLTKGGGTMAYHFRNLVFEGGGVKGIAYVCALQVLDAKGILHDIRRVGGTSAGAINAVLLGLNFSVRGRERGRCCLIALAVRN